MLKILVTGGTGFIGSHTCVALLEAGHSVVVYDNFSNSHPEVLHRMEQITGKTTRLVQGDIRDQDSLEKTMRNNDCEAVIHFAGLKAVGESFENPVDYYENNVSGTLSLLQAMKSVGVKALVFSSSATVYGLPLKLPLSEDHPLNPTNPYGRTKLMVEEILRDIHYSDSSWHIGILRYFNPVGAHPSGLIGESPKGTPNNLMPFIAQVAAGLRTHLNIWGNDYSTPDGTGVRDYLHVTDLALGHLKAIEQLKATNYFVVNLGTGRGYSVMEVLRAFEQASGQTIPYQVAARREGDVAVFNADPSLAAEMLGWKTERNLDDMCRDHWRWQESFSLGYE